MVSHDYTVFNNIYREMAEQSTDWLQEYDESGRSGQKASFKDAAEKRSVFECIAMKHLNALYGVAMKLTRDRTDAENLVQETFFKAFRFFDRYTLGTNCRAWLFKIMYNNFINQYNRRSRSPIAFNLENDNLMAFEEGIDRRYTSDIEEQVIARTLDTRMSKALEELPEDFRIPILMADVQEFPYEQIAGTMGIPVGTVKSRIFRGRRILRRQLEDLGRESGYLKEEQPAMAAAH